VLKNSTTQTPETSTIIVAEVVVTLKVEKFNGETPTEISKGLFVDLLENDKAASIFAQALVEGVCKKSETERMRKYMNMTVTEDVCVPSKHSKFKGIRVLSPFGLSKAKVQEATKISDAFVLFLEVTLNLFDVDAASECEVALRDLSVTVACEKAASESALSYKLSQVGEIKRVHVPANNTSKVCFGGTGIASCYEVKQKIAAKWIVCAL